MSASSDLQHSHCKKLPGNWLKLPGNRRKLPMELTEAACQLTRSCPSHSPHLERPRALHPENKLVLPLLDLNHPRLAQLLSLGL